MLHLYGLYTSSLYGNLLLVDPLMPPKRCNFNCITCTLKLNRELSTTTACSVQLSSIVKDVEEYWPGGVELSGILLWGYGDPLMLPDLEGVVGAIREVIAGRNPRLKILVHTTGLTLRRIIASRLLEEVDYLLVPYIWYGDNREILGWPMSIDFNAYLEALKEFSRRNRDKLVIELLTFRVSGRTYPDYLNLEETLAVLRGVEPGRIVLKSIDRPPVNRYVRPVPQTHVGRLKDYMHELGYNVTIEASSLPSTTPTWRNTACVLYNHLLRVPLKYVEIRRIYGDLATIALDNLISKNLVTRVNWGGDIYFIGHSKRV